MTTIRVPPQLPYETVWTITNSLVSSRCLQVIAEHGVADRIDGDPVGVDELAHRCGTQPEALDRLLGLLAAQGVFCLRDGGWAHTEASRLLRSDHPTSMRPFVRMVGLPVFWSSFGGLDHSLTTGAPSLERVHPNGLWGYLQAHPDEAQIFEEAMTAKAHADVAAVLAAYDFGPFPVIADIGGGRGHLLRAILDAVPTARGILFDLPFVIASLEPSRPGLAYHSGDFFVDLLPRADTYILMEVIHDWADAEATKILQAIRSAAWQGATVLIVEGILPDEGEDVRARTLDVVMLSITGGKERSARQLGALLHDAGFRLSTVVETSGPMRIVEAIAV